MSTIQHMTQQNLQLDCGVHISCTKTACNCKNFIILRWKRKAHELSQFVHNKLKRLKTVALYIKIRLKADLESFLVKISKSHFPFYFTDYSSWTKKTISNFSGTVLVTTVHKGFLHHDFRDNTYSTFCEHIGSTVLKTDIKQNNSSWPDHLVPRTATEI